MQKLYAISFILLFLVFFSFLACMNSGINIQNDITFHNLQIKFLPDENKMIAIDTLQIKYLQETNEIYFYLHDSLSVGKICVGNQTVPWEIVDKTRFYNSKDMDFVRKAMNSEHVNLYQVHLPLSLFPQTMKVYYEGAFRESLTTLEPGSALQSNECCISTGRINLPGNHFWYPSLPDSRVTYKLVSLSPVDLAVIAEGEQTLTEQSEDSVLCVWEQNTPVQYITLAAEKKLVNL